MLIILPQQTDKLTIPVRVYAGDTFLGDVRSHWERVANDVDGGVVAQCGHFIPEEKPDFVIEQVRSFFSS